ncbi:MAG TPA: CpsB/CapC family capsule biosynthesis tyrosine phosphatase [Thermodesulfovibrionia bacterium]|nr:CpsB/CapC family capsule biosynthesis tyrosine phosphatase [Thermodesulfovibrionia bacterium]
MFTDIHCHVLPGLDDGASTQEKALNMLELAWKDGITELVATPHILIEHYNNINCLKLSY